MGRSILGKSCSELKTSLHNLSTHCPRCPVCGQPLSVQLAQGRKSGKYSIMLVCAINVRHFRGFINDQSYVKGVLARVNDVANDGTAAG